MVASTERFSSRVADYVRYRPSYPAGVISLLAERCGLGPGSIVADLGSGTGILTALLLDVAGTVYAVEPNAPMREAAEAGLSGRRGFRSLSGTAEATGLPAASIDLVTAAQAFHWFDVARARKEVTRILRPGGWAALVWNERPLEAGPFLSEYEALLRRYVPEYDRITRSRADEEKIREFFGGDFEAATFPNSQELDYAGLKGRLMSSSYAPQPDTDAHEPMLRDLESLFERHRRDDRIIFPYRSLVHFGRFGRPSRGRER
jgi:SAM-dependent methyltransferase